MKLGIVLGGGGARGFAHIGVIKALEELRVPINFISGTSIGAIIGGAYAAGAFDKALSWVAMPNWRKLPRLFIDFHLSKKALIRGDRIEKFFREMLPVESFEEVNIPLAVVGTDLMCGKEVVMKTGDLHSAIRASMSVPGVFNPVQRDGHVLIDGGLVNPLPINVCSDLGADKIIAVDLNSKDGIDDDVDYMALNIFSVVDETFRVVMNIAGSRTEVSDADIILRPPLSEVSFFDFHKAKRIVKIGYEYTMDKQGELKRYAIKD